MRWRILMVMLAIGLCSTLWWCFTRGDRVAAAERRPPPGHVPEPEAPAAGSRYVSVPLPAAPHFSTTASDEPDLPARRLTVQEEREQFLVPIKASGRARGTWAADAHNQFSDLRRKFEAR